MIAILRSAVVLSSSVILASTLLASLLGAAPLKYQVNFEPASTPRGHILAGATLQLNLSWDAAALTPTGLFDGETRWGFENTTGSLTVTGSANSDGVYNGSFFQYVSRERGGLGYQQLLSLGFSRLPDHAFRDW